MTKRSFIYPAERNPNGPWAKESIQCSVLPPLTISAEMLKGRITGSPWIWIDNPRGQRTGIDAYREFTSDTIPPDQSKPTVLHRLESECREDATTIKTFAVTKPAHR